MKTYIGIDPGENGGIAVICGEHAETIKMPGTYPDILDTLGNIVNSKEECAVCLEDVGQGMPGQSSSATAKFARHMGHLEMALFALGVRTEMVKPQKWQKAYSNTIGKRDGDMSKTAWKNRLKEEAQRLFPKTKVTLWNADALLLAEYIKRTQL